MQIALEPGGLLLLLLMLTAAGLTAGFLSGLLGIGGGGVLVPVLYEAFGLAGVSEDVRMHMALGTALAVVAPTALRSFMAHDKRGAVDRDLVRRMAPYVVLGVGIGTLMVTRASSEALRWIWVVFGSLLALKMMLGRDDWRIADALPAPPWLEAAACGIGTISTLMGIGGATFTVPFLTLHGRPILQSVATATGIGIAIAIPGLIGYMLSGLGEPGLPPLSLGYVSLGALLIAPLSVLAAPFGVRVAHDVEKRTLELFFAAFLTCVVARFLWTLT